MEKTKAINRVAELIANSCEVSELRARWIAEEILEILNTLDDETVPAGPNEHPTR